MKESKTIKSIKAYNDGKTDVSGMLPKTMKQLKALLFTAYLVGRDDEQKAGRSFSDWFEDVVERQ